MAFPDPIRLPRAVDPARGADVAQRVTRHQDLIAGAAGTSPYLARLVEREAGWLDDALAADPDAVVPDLIAGLPGPEASRQALDDGLRRAKRRAHLYVALADLAGHWDVMIATRALTRFADAALAAAMAWHLAAEARRGLPAEAGLTALAMGKMGAHELNYSSDIDLVFLFDEQRHAPADEPAVRAALVRAVRRTVQSMSQGTSEGYVFRTDLRLRPDAAVNPVVLSMSMAMRYYEAQGRPWERAAFIKARAAAGDVAAGERFLAALAAFVWRRSLDFAQIAETDAIRQAIRDHRGLHEAQLQGLTGRDIKLGPGGIREIEFFAQTRQLIAGGRDRRLRVRRTVDALPALAATGWVPAQTAEALVEDYLTLRRVEHRVQMMQDAQTHALPRDADGWERLAALDGTSVADLRKTLTATLDRVTALAEPLYATPEPVARPEADVAVAERWPSYPALRSERARSIFERLKPDLLTRLSQAPRPEEAIATFDQFLRGLPAGVQLFSLFEAAPRLRDLIVDICTAAPALARYLSANAGVLDAVLDGRFFAPWPTAAALEGELTQALAGLDYQEALDGARLWWKERHFGIGVHLLHALIGPEEAARRYTALARATVSTLWPRAVAETARRLGPQPGQAALLGMGSMGGAAMTAASDLDLIVIYDASEGGPFYAKATRTLVAALGAPTPQGTLYAVDMRLRPSGRQGPVATSLAAFEAYQIDEAWTWEHLALTRARPLAGPRPLMRRLEAARRRVLATARGRRGIAADVSDMRARLSGRQSLDGKEGTGGGLDVALFAQSLALRAGAPVRSIARQIAAGRTAGLIDAAEAETLLAADRITAGVRQGLALTGAPDLDAAGHGTGAALARIAGAPDLATLIADLRQAQDAAAAVIDTRLAAASQTPD